jgi:uncharacterized membrane protein (UPF0127 family)
MCCGYDQKHKRSKKKKNVMSSLNVIFLDNEKQIVTQTINIGNGQIW